MEALERISQLIEYEGIKREDLARKTGISYSRWQTVMNKRGKVRHEEIEALGRAFPEYKLWIAYGEELPEAGQISPMTKKAQSDYKTTG